VAWYWLDARPYDPRLRRFLQPDPSTQGALPDYSYANNDPLDVSDPQGTAGTAAQCGTQAAADDPTQHAACNVMVANERLDQTAAFVPNLFGLGPHQSLPERALAWAGFLPVGWLGRGVELGVDVARGLVAAGDVAGAAQDAAAASRATSFLSEADLLLPKLGPARLSHPEEYAAIMQDLSDAGVKVNFRDGQLAYSPQTGGPGGMILDPDASIGALRHEYQHFLDVRAEGYPGIGHYLENPTEFWRLEYQGYMQEVGIARQLREFGIGRDIVGQMRTRRLNLLGF